MKKPTAVVLQFPASTAMTVRAELPLESRRALLERKAADLAIAAEDLSLRLSADQAKPLTEHQVAGYKSRIGRIRALLVDVETTANDLESDYSDSRDRM